MPNNFQELCKMKEMKEAVLNELNEFGKKSGLNSLEMAKNIFFEEENFVSRNILTNTMKLIRFNAREYYH